MTGILPTQETIRRFHELVTTLTKNGKPSEGRNISSRTRSFVHGAKSYTARTNQRSSQSINLHPEDPLMAACCSVACEEILPSSTVLEKLYQHYRYPKGMVHVLTFVHDDEKVSRLRGTVDEEIARLLRETEREIEEEREEETMPMDMSCFLVTNEELAALNEVLEEIRKANPH